MFVAPVACEGDIAWGHSNRQPNPPPCLALFFMHYNYVQRHGTLETTPAVAAGLAQEQWTVAQMIERTANYRKPEPQPPTWGEFLSTITDE